jgi:hypothetical protein
MVHTTPPKADKVDTSSAKVLTAQALVARSGSKAPDDNLADDNLDLLNFTTVESDVTPHVTETLMKVINK